MTRLGQMIYDDGLKVGEERGRKEGREEGRKEGSARMTALMKALLASGRMADLQLALDDPGYCEKLMEEYGIKYSRKSEESDDPALCFNEMELGERDENKKNKQIIYKNDSGRNFRDFLSRDGTAGSVSSQCAGGCRGRYC